MHKKIPDDDQVFMIVGRLLDTHVANWINTNCVHIVDLSFTDFMTEFKTGYLDEGWEEDTHHNALGMSQGMDSFWNYAVTPQAKNFLLHGTTSHLLDEQVCHQLGASMELRLLKKISVEKVNKIIDFCKWLVNCTGMGKPLGSLRVLLTGEGPGTEILIQEKPIPTMYTRPYLAKRLT